MKIIENQTNLLFIIDPPLNSRDAHQFSLTKNTLCDLEGGKFLVNILI
jgi:hypothetical protein